MESNLTFFSLPFVDTPEIDYSRVKSDGYEDLHSDLGGHGSLLGPDDVLAQFLSGDEPLEEPDLNGPATLHCEICKKQFGNAKKYYGHLRVHSKDNLWTCDKCPDVRFSTKQQLMKHTLIHKPLEKVWKCPQCDQAFEALFRLQQHLFAKHLGYSPHKCDVCGKHFHKLSELKKHKTVHEDKRMYGCTECDARFKDNSNLKRHMFTHGEKRAFGCDGCNRRYKQVGSLRRHTAKCAKFQKLNQAVVKEVPANNSRNMYMEPSIRPQPIQQFIEPPKDNSQLHVATNCTVDKIVDDILSAEDDYMTIPQQNNLLNYPQEPDNNLMHIELLKDINNMQILDDELLYNDIDLDTLQNMCNNIDRNEMFDINDTRIDQDDLYPINELYQKETDELLNTNDMLNDPKGFLEQTAENECSTIFETDIDLEASTNLTANLNQLITENNVQYISNENDDTFIISLNGEIDAEQLTDMLNIGGNLPEDSLSNDKNKPDYTLPEIDNTEDVNSEPIILKIEKPVTENNVNNKENELKKVKVKKTLLYICRKCNKLFNKKDNYWSHRATHEPELRYHKCKICKIQFGYKSSLNKHILRHHTTTYTKHTCTTCDKSYKTSYDLRRHIGRTHTTKNLPFACPEKGCDRRYFHKSDLKIHSKSHSSERPFSCTACQKTFRYKCHYNRHARTCTINKNEPSKEDNKKELKGS